jgi:hypothetical protein
MLLFVFSSFFSFFYQMDGRKESHTTGLTDEPPFTPPNANCQKLSPNTAPAAAKMKNEIITLLFEGQTRLKTTTQTKASKREREKKRKTSQQNK